MQQDAQPVDFRSAGDEDGGGAPRDFYTSFYK